MRLRPQGLPGSLPSTRAAIKYFVERRSQHSVPRASNSKLRKTGSGCIAALTRQAIYLGQGTPSDHYRPSPPRSFSSWRTNLLLSRFGPIVRAELNGTSLPVNRPAFRSPAISSYHGSPRCSGPRFLQRHSGYSRTRETRPRAKKAQKKAKVIT